VHPWFAAAARVAAFVFAGLAAGWAFGSLALWLGLVLAAALLWHLGQLHSTLAWLKRADTDDPPDAPGLWGDLTAQLRELLFRDRKRERRLAAMLKEYQDSTAAMPDAAVVLADNGDILWFNDAARRILGLSAPRDVGQRIDNLIRVPRFVSYIAQADYTEPLELVSPHDRSMRLVVHVVPYGTGQRLLMFRDITRLHQLEKMRRKFVANASHELRTPLTVLAGYVDAMAEDPALAGEWRAPIAEMQRQAARMNAIIGDLLELSQLEATRAKAPADEVALRPLLEQIVAEASAVRPDPPAIALRVDSHLPLRGSESELHSAFSNLVVNAVKFTPSEGHVVVRWYTDDEGGHLETVDTGIGIERRHLDRLTERFYRVDTGRSRRDGGTGLGLAIVKHVLERHDARLEIESRPGHGSRFCCHFPPARVGSPESARGEPVRDEAARA
jgi:two-component system, OmpR family, phosphate regulon sensor histidine kinase PhoR